MTPASVAAILNHNEYREEGDTVPTLFEDMKKAGLVAVFGASDDLTEFRGAIDDEGGADIIYLTRDGIFYNDCENEDCPYFLKLRQKASTITPIWGVGPLSWSYETDIPHEKFFIDEDGQPYCEGIVFSLADVP